MVNDDGAKSKRLVFNNGHTILADHVVSWPSPEAFRPPLSCQRSRSMRKVMSRCQPGQYSLFDSGNDDGLLTTSS